MGKLMIKRNSQLVLDEVRVANTYWSRLIGLMGKKEFSGKGLLFPRSNSIHMWMMSMPIDVIFLKEIQPGKEWSIVQLHRSVRPWKLLPLLCARADDTLEVSAGLIEQHQLREGEVLCIAS